MRTMYAEVNEKFETYRKRKNESNISCEIVNGCIVKTEKTTEEERELCFIIGTMLEDHIEKEQMKEKIEFGPVNLKIDIDNQFLPDLVAYRAARKGTRRTPRFIVEFMSENQQVNDCLVKAVTYYQTGVEEYWLIDLKREYVLTYFLKDDFLCGRHTFDYTIKSVCYPGFECCIGDLMRHSNGNLKTLSFFYQFRRETEPVTNDVLLEESASYAAFQEEKYSAEQFYEWLQTRKYKESYTKMVELLLGDIREYDMPDYAHQSVRGELYFEIKGYLKEKKLPYQLYFTPTAIEFKKLDLFDSVVTPDLFLGNMMQESGSNIYHGIPKWVIEIASPATASQDYIDKAQIYQYHGVQEYWIVNPWKKQVLVTRYKPVVVAEDEKEAEKEDVDSTIYTFNDIIQVEAIPGLRIRMFDILRNV